MHVLDEIRVDGAGRICITNVFDEMPKEVLILYDTEENAVYFRGDITGTGLPHSVKSTQKTESYYQNGLGIKREMNSILLPNQSKNIAWWQKIRALNPK